MQAPARCPIRSCRRVDSGRLSRFGFRQNAKGAQQRESVVIDVILRDETVWREREVRAAEHLEAALGRWDPPELALNGAGNRPREPYRLATVVEVAGFEIPVGDRSPDLLHRRLDLLTAFGDLAAHDVAEYAVLGEVRGESCAVVTVVVRQEPFDCFSAIADLSGSSVSSLRSL